MTTKQLVDNCIAIVRDVNAEEIYEQLKSGKLETWCARWQSEMLYRLITLISDFAERENRP